MRRKPWTAARRAGAAKPRFLATWKGSAFALALFALLFIAASRLDLTPEPTALSGMAIVHDGDTVTIGGERVRLKGIDAPEFDQTCRRGGAEYRCGAAARDALRRLVSGGGVSCEGWRRDRYGRLLTVCRRGGDDLNARLVAEGWAVAYGAYEAQQHAARAARRGLWAGDFARPADWRAERGDAVERPHDLLDALIEIVARLFRFS